MFFQYLPKLTTASFTSEKIQNHRWAENLVAVQKKKNSALLYIASYVSFIGSYYTNGRHKAS